MTGVPYEILSKCTGRETARNKQHMNSWFWKSYVTCACHYWWFGSYFLAYALENVNEKACIIIYMLYSLKLLSFEIHLLTGGKNK